MEASIRIMRIWGIPIGLHISWFLIFGLVTWSLAAGYFPAEYPGMAQPAYWVLGAVTSVLFFGSVVVHELGHAYLAQRNNIPVRSITLFLFGGVAQLTREPQTPGVEFRIAIAGPLASLGLALLFGAAWLLARDVPVVAAPSIWLARINLLLAVFNMIPGFPLDGGRVLRAVVWSATKNFHRATQAAAIVGQVVAVGFIALGIYDILAGRGLFNGLWLIFIGWFLQNAAAASYAQANTRQALRGITAGQVMSRGCSTVPGQVSLERLVVDQILEGGQRCFFVTDGAEPQGILTLADIGRVPQAERGQVTASQAMRPWRDVRRIAPDTELLEALQVMDDANVNQVPVVEAGAIVGLLSREQMLHYLRARAELGV